MLKFVPTALINGGPKIIQAVKAIIKSLETIMASFVFLFRLESLLPITFIVQLNSLFRVESNYSAFQSVKHLARNYLLN